MRKRINWNQEKNILLQKERNINFEEIKEKIINSDIIDDIYNPKQYEERKSKNIRPRN